MSGQKLAEPAAQTSGMVSPARLAHVVMRTSRLKEMLAWYKFVLNAEVAFENDEIAFLAYDDVPLKKSRTSPTIWRWSCCNWVEYCLPAYSYTTS